MQNIKYHVFDTAYTTDGGAIIPDLISGKIAREATGKFVLTFTIPNTDYNRRMCNLMSNNYFSCISRPGEAEEQMFFPKKIRYKNGLLEFTCEHISSALSSVFYLRWGVEEPFTNSQEVCDALTDRVQHYDGELGRFVITSTDSISGEFEWEKARSISSLLFGGDVSVLTNYGGMIDINNFTITHKAQGEETEEFIYGENLLPDYYEMDASGYAEIIYAYYTGTIGMAGEINFPHRADISRQRILKSGFALDTTEMGDDYRQALQYAQNWANNNLDNYPDLQYKAKINPLLMYQTTEPGTHQPVDLQIGSAVHIVDTSCDLDLTAYITSYTYDLIKDQFTDIEISNVKNKLGRLLGKLAKETGIRTYQ